MSRATPDLTQGFTGLALPGFGPRQMGTDADGKTSVITFLNAVMAGLVSLHDDESGVRPDFLPANGLWANTAGDGTKTVYMYDGTADIPLWSIDITGNLALSGLHLAVSATNADPATGAPGIVFPDGKSITMTGEGMLKAAGYTAGQSIGISAGNQIYLKIGANAPSSNPAQLPFPPSSEWSLARMEGIGLNSSDNGAIYALARPGGSGAPDINRWYDIGSGYQAFCEGYFLMTVNGNSQIIFNVIIQNPNNVSNPNPYAVAINERGQMSALLRVSKGQFIYWTLGNSTTALIARFIPSAPSGY